MRIAYKLFLSFLFSSLLIVIMMIGITYYLAQYNFKEFIIRTEMERLDEIVLHLQKIYTDTGNWQSIKKNPSVVMELFMQSHPPDFTRKPPLTVNHEPGIRPPHVIGVPPFMMGMEKRISLYDSQDNIIFGEPLNAKNNILKNITVNGKVVGLLGFKKQGKAPNHLERKFLFEQIQGFFLTGLIALIISGIVSYLLAGHFLKPVQELTSGARAIASRNFETRIGIKSNDELGLLAEDFNKMATTLERYETMRKQWISDISHELRTPLSILQGEIEAVQDGVRETNNNTWNSLHAEVMILSKLVNDLHELAIAETGTITVNNEKVKPLILLGDIINLFRDKLAEQKISLETDFLSEQDIQVIADQERLSQVFINLMENSLRYTESPGHLKIFSRKTDQTLSIYFEDSKPGVPDESLPKLFDRLYRVDSSRTRNEGGSGLGLSICKSIMKIFGGEINAYHSPLGGLGIEISFPLIRRYKTEGGFHA